MSTLLDMERRIVDETGITRITVIRNQIFDAVKYYKNVPFWFNTKLRQFVLTLTTTTGHPISPYIPDLIEVLHLRVLTSNTNYNVLPLSLEKFQDLGVASQATWPQWFMVYNKQLHVWPRLQATLTFEAAYIGDTTLTNSASASTEWTNEAEELIRTRAMAGLYENFQHDLDKAMFFHQKEYTLLSNLRERTHQYEAGSSDIVGYWD